MILSYKQIVQDTGPCRHVVYDMITVELNTKILSIKQIPQMLVDEHKQI